MKLIIVYTLRHTVVPILVHHLRVRILRTIVCWGQCWAPLIQAPSLNPGIAAQSLGTLLRGIVQKCPEGGDIGGVAGLTLEKLDKVVPHAILLQGK